MTAGQRYVIDDVGGIRHAELALEPGVNVLSGVNGAGKTSAFKAIVRAEGGEVALEARDGAGMGTVRGPGDLMLKIGRTVRSSGEARLGLSDTTPASTLIDPQLKDEAAAARASLRALVQILRLTVDDAAIAKLCGGDTEVIERATKAINEDFTEDLFVASEKIRGVFHALARDYETEAEQAKGVSEAAQRRAAEILETIGGEERLTDLSVEAATAAVRDSGREYERAEAACHAREKLEARQTKLRETIGPHPDLPAAQEDELAVRAQQDAVAQEIAGLEAKLANARERAAARAAERRAAVEKIDAVTEQLRLWNEAQAVLDQAVEGPDRQALERIQREQVDTAAAKLTLARQSDDYRAAAVERAEADERGGIAGREAIRYRGLATGIPHHLGELLSAHGAEGLTVVNGRIHVQTEGGLVDFYKRRSEGQRTRKTLEVALRAQGKGTIVPFGPAVYASLDPSARAELARAATELELYVLTEQPTDGPLRVEHDRGSEPTVETGPASASAPAQAVEDAPNADAAAPEITEQQKGVFN